jgi:hypothetical protein
VTDWKAFFKTYGKDSVNPVKIGPDDTTHMSIEDLYQAFKSRLDDEREEELRNIKFAILGTMLYAEYSINSKQYERIAQMLFPDNENTTKDPNAP